MENFVLNIGNRYFALAEQSYPRIAMNALKNASKQQIETIEQFIEAANKTAGISWIQSEIEFDDIISHAYIAHFDLTYARQVTINNELVPVGIGSSTYSMVKEKKLVR